MSEDVISFRIAVRIHTRISMVFGIVIAEQLCRPAFAHSQWSCRQHSMPQVGTP